MIVLGIETSCDETAIGIVDGDRTLLANRIASQIADHMPYGGVVPEVAARAHLDKIDDLIRGALADAKLSFKDLSGIAATCGPGLIGGVMVGAMMGKALSSALKLPFIAVNHLAAHALTTRLTNNVQFPYLLLLVSGGHSQIMIVHGVETFEPLGTTIDDAVGECFDKSAKLLGLSYPGGPLVEKLATGGNTDLFPFPRPMTGRDGCDMSFSGLKTAIRQTVEDLSPLTEQQRSDIAASLQSTIAAILVDRVGNGFKIMQQESVQPTALVVAGGVAANQTIRAALTKLASQQGVPFVAAPPALCTDNGVMIAWAGLEKLRLGKTDPLDTACRPRWPLEQMA